MRAERFYGDADRPEVVIDTASDGTPLPDCRGWICGGCGSLFAAEADGELCCLEPDAAVTGGTE